MGEKRKKRSTQQFSIIERYDRPFEYASILTSLIIAAQFFMLWLQPGAGDADLLRSTINLTFFNLFIIAIISGMTLLPPRYAIITVLLFGLFIYYFNLIVGHNYVFYTLLMAGITRLRYSFVELSPLMRNRITIRSIIGVILYGIVLMFSPFALGHIPYLGLTPHFLHSINLSPEASSVADYITTTDYMRMPYLAIFTNIVYYVLMAAIDFVILLGIFDPRTDSSKKRITAKKEATHLHKIAEEGRQKKGATTNL